MVNAFVAGQSSYSLQEQCTTLSQDLERLKREWNRKEALVKQLTADRSKLNKEVEDLQSQKAMAVTELADVKNNFKISEDNRVIVVEKCREEEARSAALEAEKGVLEERNRVQGERIQELESSLATLQASRDDIIRAFLAEDFYLQHVGRETYHLLRSFAPLFAAKFPPPISAQIAEGFRVFYEGYYGDCFVEAPPAPEDDLTPEELRCQGFADWAPILPP